MRCFLSFLAISTLSLGGCIPYVLPSLDATRPIDLAENAGEVHAFRVNITSKSGAPCYGAEDFSLEEIALVAGTVPPQVQAGLDHGIIIIGVALNYHFHYHNGVHVRLYRPGYQLCQFKSWELGKKLAWIPAEDFKGREKAIDDLLAAPGTVDWCKGGFTFQKPTSGPAADKHRATLAFARSEYMRLAWSDDPLCTQETRQRLLGKVGKLREGDHD